MDISNYQIQASKILKELSLNGEINQYIDDTLTPPEPYGPDYNAKLIFLGQDPTVKNAKSRSNIRVVLNLDKGGALRIYLKSICSILSLDIDKEVAAINAANNFFIKPPSRLPSKVLATAIRTWLPLLKSQLEKHPNAIIISLGEPILEHISSSKASHFVREYWGHFPKSFHGNDRCFKHIPANQNLFGRTIFPFPHQPSINKVFYKNTLVAYSKYVLQVFKKYTIIRS